MTDWEKLYEELWTLHHEQTNADAAEIAKLRDLIERMRAQWIHSVHAPDCLAALGEVTTKRGSCS